VPSDSARSAERHATRPCAAATGRGAELYAGCRKTYVYQAYLQGLSPSCTCGCRPFVPLAEEQQDVIATTCDKARALAPETLRIW
jgi:hypothetical protein